jgi:hypothetical protein
VNPVDLAAARFKPVKQALERIAKAEQAQAKARARLEELRGAVGPAETRDKWRLGHALVDGKAEPPSEAAKLKAELEQEERRVEAINSAVEAAHGVISHLVAEHRDSWRRQAVRALGEAKSRYEAAIAELEAARVELIDEATLITWLDRGEMGEAANPALDFPRTVEELRADVRHLAAHPDTRRGGLEVEPQIDIGRMRDGAAAASLWGGR